MKKRERFIVFFIFVVVGLLLLRLNHIRFSLNVNISITLVTIYIFACISVFISENFFTKPSDIIISSISIFITLIPFIIIDNFFFNKPFNYYIYIYIIFIIAITILSIMTLLISDKNKSKNNLCNRISKCIKNIVCKLGNGKMLYTISFIFFVIQLLCYNDKQKIFLIPVLLIILVLINIDTKKSIYEKIKLCFIKIKRQDKIFNDIASIISIDSDNVVVAKLYKDYEYKINLLQIVILNFSNEKRVGVIIEKISLVNEKRIKLVLLDYKIEECIKLEKNIIYKFQKENNHKLEEILNKFVGIITIGSSIDTIYFRYVDKNEIKEGNILEVNIRSKKIYYQVINGCVKMESIHGDENDKNIYGYIVGEAIQLGEFIKEDTKNKKYNYFVKYSWIPKINTVVLKMDTFDIYEEHEENFNKIKIGTIPNTNIPVNFNFDNDVLNHHIAILGVTGTGKTMFFAKGIVENIKSKSKILIFDLTSEYKKKFDENRTSYFDYSKEIENLKDIHYYKYNDNDRENKIRKINGTFKNAISSLSNLEAGHYGRKHYKEIRKTRNNILLKLETIFENFIENKENLGLITIPELSNDYDSISLFGYIIDSVFRKMKYFYKNVGNKNIVLALEEAHTLVPEWNSTGGMSDTKISQSMVNKVSQIALQGRKYNIGLFVISQRTANVSKTVLTQCNTIISFRSYDPTSRDFLSSYITENMANRLSGLEKQQAIIFGKGFDNNVPVICQIKNLNDNK